MTTLQGKFTYQSFVSLPGDPLSTPAPRKEPLLAAVWAPPTEMDLKTDAAGAITGTAKFSPLEATVTGKIKPAAGPRVPEGVELTVKVAKTESVYQLRGYFLTGSNEVAGIVACLNYDLAGHPVGTRGAFVMRALAAAGGGGVG